MKNRIKYVLIALSMGILPQILMGQNSNQSISGPTTGTAQSQADFIKVKTQQNQPTIELSVWSGYMFGGKFDRYDYYYNISDGQDWGGAVSVEFAPNTFGEFSYNFLGTDAEYKDYNQAFPTMKYEGVNVNYFQLGAQKIFGRNEQVQPFGVFSLGMTYFNRDKTSDIYAFSGTAGAGVKIFLTENIGIRLQGRFMLPMYFSGIGFGVGTGGVSGGAYFGAYALQGDFSGGLIFRLK